MRARGKKPFEEADAGVVPIRVIAKRMGVSERTAWNDWKNAQKKLKEDPEAFSLLLECVHGVAASEQELMQCCSVECDRDYIEKFSH